MKKVLVVTIGMIALTALAFVVKEISRQIRISNAVEILSNRYVYLSIPRQDRPSSLLTADRSQRQTECMKAFLFFHRAASERRVKKEMNNPNPSMRVYAYMANLVRTKDVRFDYLVKQLEFKDEIRFTDNEEYFVETRCFACDVMLYCGLGCDYASIYNLPIPDENSGYGLTRCQADSLLTILGEDEIPVYDFRDLEIISALERIAK